MVHSFHLIVVAAFAVLFAQSQGQTRPPTEHYRWQKINLNPVCFEAKGNKPGQVTYVSTDDAVVGAMKLVHVSGTVRCHPDPKYNSKWGCNNVGVYQYSLNVIVTDMYNHVIYPSQKYVKSGDPALWYYLPNIHTLNSNELVFTNYKDPFFLPRDSPLKIWYGEDLKNKWDYNNFGRVCVDVYIHAL